MQKTAIDRYLIRKFVQKTAIFTNTLPINLPRGIKAEKSPDNSGSRYRYRLMPRNEKALIKLAATLDNANITYTSRVEDKGGISNRIFNNPNKSFTIDLITLILVIAACAFMLSGVPLKLIRNALSDESESKQNTFQSTSDPIHLRFIRNNYSL